MVHYKPIYDRKATRSADVWERDKKDSYWMLGFYKKSVNELKEVLDTYDYRYPKSATKAVLIDAVGRCQRGLLSYKKCTITELRTFCDARALTIPSKSTTVSRLSRVLDTADDDATFPRLLDLPVELRIKIYRLHFLGYSRLGIKHRQPPLTMVPKIRAEALPLFYACVTFSWHLGPHFSSGIYFGYQFENSGQALLKMPAANLAQIRNFQLHWIGVWGDNDGKPKRFVDFHARVSQSNNAKKNFEFSRTNDSIDLRRMRGAIRNILQSMGFGESTCAL